MNRDDRPLLICQFLCHVTKLETERAQEKEKRMGLYVWVGSTIDAAKISDFTACSCIWTLGPNNPTERVHRMYEMAGQILASDQSRPHRGEATPERAFNEESV